MNPEFGRPMTTSERLAALQSAPETPQWRKDVDGILAVARLLVLAGLALGVVLRVALFVAGL